MKTLLLSAALAAMAGCASAPAPKDPPSIAQPTAQAAATPAIAQAPSEKKCTHVHIPLVIDVNTCKGDTE